MPGQFPWFANVQGSRDYDGEWFSCGGTLITPRHILTAASCLINATEVNIEMNGRYYNGYSEDYFNTIAYNIGPHPSYKEGGSDYNVAIITLSSAVPNVPFIKPIGLGSESPYASNEAYIMGTGRTSFNGMDYYLRWAKVRTITNEKCATVFGSKVTDRVICAEGADNPWQSACYGDEGSSMVVKEDGVWKIIGVINFISEIGCGLEQPFGNTRVSGAIKAWVSAYTGAV